MTPGAQSVLVGVDDQLAAEFLRAAVAEFDHLAKFPCRVDMQQRERQRRGIERLECQMQQDRAVLADGIQQHGVVGGRDDLAEDVDALGFQALEVGQGLPGPRPAWLTEAGLRDRCGADWSRRRRRSFAPWSATATR